MQVSEKQQFDADPAVMILIEDARANVLDKQTHGELPFNYSHFVDNLFKEFETLPLTAVHAVLGISGEAGELTDTIKKLWAYGKTEGFGDKKESLAKNILEESGDILFYFQKLLNMFNLTIEDVIAYNMDKLSKRYHEGKFSEAQAIARADKAE